MAWNSNALYLQLFLALRYTEHNHNNNTVLHVTYLVFWSRWGRSSIAHTVRWLPWKRTSWYGHWDEPCNIRTIINPSLSLLSSFPLSPFSLSTLLPFLTYTHQPLLLTHEGVSPRFFLPLSWSWVPCSWYQLQLSTVGAYTPLYGNSGT